MPARCPTPCQGSDPLQPCWHIGVCLGEHPIVIQYHKKVINPKFLKQWRPDYPSQTASHFICHQSGLIDDHENLSLLDCCTDPPHHRGCAPLSWILLFIDSNKNNALSFIINNLITSSHVESTLCAWWPGGGYQSHQSTSSICMLVSMQRFFHQGAHCPWCPNY